MSLLLATSFIVTIRLTVPALPAGVVHVIEVSVVTEKLATSEVPKVTLVAPVNPVPVIITDVPPAVVPEVGDTDDTTGGVI